MRRPFAFLLPVLLALSSCQGAPSAKIPVFSYPVDFIRDGEPVSLYYDCHETLETMVAKKMTFPLLVRVPGCGFCENFQYLLDAFVAENDVVLPYVVLGYFHDVSGLSLENSSIVLYVNGKIQEIHDLVESDEDLFSFLDSRLSYTGISILNACLAEEPFRSQYPVYTFLGGGKGNGEEYVHAPFDRESLATDKAKILFIQSESITDYSGVFQSLESLGIDGFLAIDEDMENLTEAEFSAFYGFEKGEATKSFTYVDYSDGFLLSDDSLSSLLELVDLR